MFYNMLRDSLAATISGKIGYVFARKAFKEFKKRLDYSEYGGAPLLGIRGVCIITHGRSNANAIKNSIRVAAEFASGKINEQIEDELSRWSAARLSVVEAE
jgi:glycerol-3-phosphate acyltransferase PlsX